MTIIRCRVRVDSLIWFFDGPPELFSTWIIWAMSQRSIVEKIVERLDVVTLP